MYRFEKVRPLILATRSESALVEVMREFCTGWMPSDLQKLPAECRGCEVRNVDDISDLAVLMRSCELRTTDPEIAPTLQVLARAFVLASEQLRRIRPSPFDVGEPKH